MPVPAIAASTARSVAVPTLTSSGPVGSLALPGDAVAALDGIGVHAEAA